MYRRDAAARGRPVWSRPAGRPIGADLRGATIVEFSLVAPLFLFLMLGFLEAGLVYFVQESLETLAESTVRSVATGRFATGGDGEPRLAQAACEDLPSFLRCDRLQIDLRSVPTAAEVGRVAFPPLDARGGQVRFGGPSDMVVLRLLYRWPLRLSPLGVVIRGAQARDGYVLAATRVAKAEGYRQ